MRPNLFLFLCPLAILAAGCSSDNKAIITDPPGADVTINDTPIGQTPLKFDFDFDKRMKYEVSVTKDGYLSAAQTIYSDTAMAHAGQLRYDLPKDPSWQETTESQAANTWLKIQISPQFTQESMWQRLVDSITTRYANIEQMDQASGYIRSVPIVKTYKTPAGNDSIRTYFLGSIASADPLVFKVKIVSERSAGQDQWLPWHRIFREDDELIEELQNRMGMK
jgi:hypothetical protein